MKKKTKGAGKPAPKGDTTSTKRSNAKIARWQAAAERDGFETWSQALTAWSKGEACLTKREPDPPLALVCECGSLYGVHEEFCPKFKSASG